MSKRLISLLLVFTMMLTMLPVTALAAPVDSGTSRNPANPFTDVKEGDWCYDAVQYARVNGFFNGNTATTFNPDGTMTRGMFVTVLGRMAGVNPDDYSGKSEFTDVPVEKYYAPYVQWAATYGITNGTGNGTFSPNAHINRQQLAAFFVRYFEAFGVDYETGANITTIPADMASVAPYAKDAVLKLWKQGLLNGDGKNFNPFSSATRAQTATLCTRTDKAIDVWYSAPGVVSERVSIDPATGEAVKPGATETPSSGGSSSGGSSGSGGSSTTKSYYVEFLLGDGQSSAGVTLPTSQTYAYNTPISQLPTPTVPQGTIFLGWYYDSSMNTAVGMGDCVTRSTKLYAKLVSGEQVMPMETPNYITKDRIPSGDYTFQVYGVDNIDDDAIKFINITGGNMTVDYTVNGNTVSASLEAGQTYQVELLNDEAYFGVDRETQDVSVRYLNILTAKGESKKATLNEELPIENASTVEGLDDAVFEGLYQTDNQGNTRTNTTAGTFTASQVYAVGETVAFTRGNVDLTDVSSETGDVAYVKIVGVTGPQDGKYTYSYEMADVEDVLFMPDTLPISDEADTDNDNTNHSITVSADVIVAAMAAVEAASLNEGDYIAFYSGELDDENTNVVQYAEITEVTANGNSYIIAYEPYESETAYNSALAGDLDVYYEKDKDIELTEEEQEQLQEDLMQDVQESGYVEQAAMYLTAMMLESDNLNELPDAEQINAMMGTMDVVATGTDDGFVLAGSSARVSFNWANGSVRIDKDPEKLDANSGFDVEIRVPFTIHLNDKVAIDVVAEFQEEVVLKQKISTKRHKIGFLKYDYSLNASFEVGNYTGIDFSATVHTTDNNTATDELGKRLETILTVIKNQSEGVDIGTGMEGLSEAYQDLMKSAGDNWVDIIEQQLFCSNGNAFLHIFCWQVKGSFVVSVNMNVAMGMTFEYITHKQYNYSVRVKAKTSTNETIDLVPTRYSFDFYVMGSLAVRAGLRLEMYVGLFSLKLDKIGIMAEAGAYVQLWGYFFYHKEWTENLGTKSNSAGAMLIEIGIYIDIKFVAQLFNSSKLTYNPTLYAHQWPLWSAGEVKNVYAFADTGDSSYEFKAVKTLALPSSTYLMKAMDLKSGKISSVNRDDASESSFIISFSNPAFAYIPATNTVTVTPTGGSLAEETNMTITWKKAPLTFTSAPIQKVISLSWSDPEGARYIAFDSMGGSAVEQLSAGSGAAIIWPVNPTKQGYTFAGWYTDSSCTEVYSGSTTEMPTFAEGTKGMTLYAKWTPATASYMVEHYWQTVDGGYEVEYERKSGTVETLTVNSAKSATGFTVKSVQEQTIAADDSTVIKVYYEREKYDVVFESGYEGAEDITKSYAYGAELSAPNMSRTGYTFAGWNTELPATMPAEALTFTAKWTLNTYTVIWKNGDAVLETDEGAAYGATPGYSGAEPTRADDAQYSYAFAGWNTREDGSGTTVTAVTGPVTYYAQYDKTLQAYTVTWKDHDETPLETDENVEYGTAPTYNGDEPTKDATEQHNYVFTGWNTEKDGSGTAWSDAITVTGDVTYYAQYTEKLNTFTVIWKNEGGSILETDEAVEYGATPTYDSATPTKAADAQYTYTFDGWSPEVSAVTGEATYTATYTETLNAYTVIWKNDDGNVLETDKNVVYGTEPNYDGETPTKAADAQYTYTFAGWDTATSAVTGNVTYTATYTGTLNKYTVTWEDEDGTTLETDENVEYGATPTYDSATPTKEATAQYSYTFAGWSPRVSSVTGHVTYNATYTATVNRYTVTFDTTEYGSTVDAQTVAYGSTIIKPAEEPTRDGYDFHGWYKDEEYTEAWDFETDTVTGATTLYAKWNEGERVFYGLWIGNTEFTSACLAIDGDSGTATYNPTNNTLMLNDFRLTAESNDTGYGLIHYSGTDTLNIVLDGTNCIQNTRYAHGSSSSGLHIGRSDVNLNITGSGNLTCIGGTATADTSLSTSYSNGIYIQSGVLTVDITGTLTAEGGCADATFGIYSKSTVIESGTVEAIGGAVDTTVESETELGIKGSYGLYGSATLYSGVTLTAEGETRAFYVDTDGAKCGVSVNTTASENMRLPE